VLVSESTVLALYLTGHQVLAPGRGRLVMGCAFPLMMPARQADRGEPRRPRALRERDRGQHHRHEHGARSAPLCGLLIVGMTWASRMRASRTYAIARQHEVELTRPPEGARDASPVEPGR
jgi:hypothetical protein